MKVTVLENEKDKLKIDIDDLTFVNVLNETIWNQDKAALDYAGYSVDHPYLTNPVLVVKSKNPKKTVIDAALQIEKDVSALKKQASTQLK
jgi:DNA-directed RNA polymerase subunit L